MKKQDGTAYLLWCACLFGACGLHRFYAGDVVVGVIYFFTFGLFGIGQLIDLFRIPEIVERANRRGGYLDPPQVVIQLGAGQSISVGGRQISTTTAAPTQLPVPPKKKRDPEQEMMVSLLEAAKERGGQITVTEGVMVTGKGFADVEAVLDKMLKSGYVDIGNDDETGVMVYRFPELVK